MHRGTCPQGGDNSSQVCDTPWGTEIHRIHHKNATELKETDLENKKRNTMKKDSIEITRRLINGTCRW